MSRSRPHQSGLKNRVALLAAALLVAWASTFWPETAAAAADEHESKDPPLIAESFVCRGNQSTSCDFILSHLYLAAGDSIDEKEIRDATLRLRWLRNFDAVSIYLERGSERGRARVVVEVTEATPFTYQAALGFNSLAHSVGTSAFGRLTHYNLFGEGKILDFTSSLLVPIDGPLSRGERASLEYIDPHVDGSRRTFASAGVWYQNDRREWDNGDVADLEQLAIDVSAGRRLWAFSYFSVGYRFRPVSEVYIQRRQRNGQLRIRETTNHGGPMAGFGWNSEDDPVFPTQGSRLRVVYVRAFDGEDEFGVSFRKNWQFGEGPGVWTFITETNQALSLQYARPLAGLAARRARWYAAPFLRHLYNKPDGGMVREFGLSAGVQIETHSFGLVHLYVLGSAVSVGGGN